MKPTQLENIRLGMIESVTERYWKMQPPSLPLAPAYAVFCFKMFEPNSPKEPENDWELTYDFSRFTYKITTKVSDFYCLIFY